MPKLFTQLLLSNNQHQFSTSYTYIVVYIRFPQHFSTRILTSHFCPKYAFWAVKFQSALILSACATKNTNNIFTQSIWGKQLQLFGTKWFKIWGGGRRWQGEGCRAHRLSWVIRKYIKVEREFSYCIYRVVMLIVRVLLVLWCLKFWARHIQYMYCV